MQEDCSTFSIPSFAQREVYDFDNVSSEDLAIYEELSNISEEIEKCRLRNS